MQFLAQYADWVYLVAAILFILALKGLSSPLGASMGNRYGMIGMLLSVLITFAVAPNPNIALIVGAIAAGAVDHVDGLAQVLGQVGLQPQGASFRCRKPWR